MGRFNSAHTVFSLSLLCVMLSLSACSNDNDRVVEKPVTDAVDMQALTAEAQALTKEFIGTLQPMLQAALQSEGPAAAIEICADAAPGIARQLSAASGWQVHRVSLRPRNTATALPDSWETTMLEQFNARQRAGEPGTEINTASLVDGDFRYMQAQPVGPLCLTCHGSELGTEVTAALAELYPGDRATGYALGEIRGAISVRTGLNHARPAAP